LPTELLHEILSYVLGQPPNSGFSRADAANSRGLILDDYYSSSHRLEILVTCVQFHDDFSALAFRKTTFVVRDIYSTLGTLLRRVEQHHVRQIRKIARVATSRQLQDMVHWARWPFNIQALDLDELTIVFHRSAHWHYPSDHTAAMVALLRRLRNVRILKFVLNAAHVKGSFRTWYNRLIGLMLKEDHYQRYDAPNAPNVEATWWEWSYSEDEMSFQLVAREPKPIVSEEEYMNFAAPMVRRLMEDMALEEEDPDPRVRNGA
ncbi:hypothetical protein BU26DRAFT_389112, partial [Trematosphaeria pertusa]